MITTVCVLSCSLPSCTDYQEDLRKQAQSASIKPVTVTLHVDDAFSILNDVYIPSDANASSFLKVPSLSDSWIRHYYVAVYEETGDKDARTYSSTDSVFHLSMKSGNYRFVAWADNRPEGESFSYFFHTDDFSEMLLRNKYRYESSDSLKIPYHAISDVFVNYAASHSVDMTLTPAMSRYRLVATDSADYPVGHVVVSYTSPIPAAIDARYGNVCWSWSNIAFISHTVGDVVASDAIFAHDTDEISVSLKVEVYDVLGELRARRSNISFPLVNAKTTIVRDSFFTQMDTDDSPPSPEPEDGNVSINPDFDGSFDIQI